MNYKLTTKRDESNNKIAYIIYENGKTIELYRNKKYKVLKNNKHIFIINGNVLEKVFDVNNKRFLTKAIDMKILYNNYKTELKKEYRENKKILKQD